MEQKSPIIIDTDPGVDDALAIMFAVAAGMPIQAVTTTYGNASLNDTTRNTLTILELLHTKIPVYKGAALPLVGKPYYATVHGTNGLGGYTKSNTTNIQNKSAIHLLRRLSKLNVNPYTLICLGPTTNIAKATQQYPSLVKDIGMIILLGGVIGQKGNVTPYAEFNVYNDPFALQQTLQLPCNKLVIPINVCRKVQFSKKDFDRINNLSLRNTIQSITDMYISYYMGNTKHGGFTGGVMYDLLATMYPLYPTLFSLEEACVIVETNQNARYGQTTTSSNKPNCLLMTDVQSEGLKEVFFHTVNNWNK